MHERFLRPAIRHAALVAAGATALSLFARALPTTVGVAAGALVGLANLWLLGRLGSILTARMVATAPAEKPSGAKFGFASAALMLKTAVTLGALWAAVHFLGASPLAMAVGFGAVFGSIVLDALRYHTPQPDGGAAGPGA